MGCGCCKKKKTNKLYFIQGEEKNQGEELSTTAGANNKINSLLGSKNQGNEQNEEGLNTSKGPSLRDYELITYLDSGSFGKVSLVRLKSTHELFAMKVINKEYLVMFSEPEKALNELNIWIKVKSDFVANIKQAFQDKNYLYLISEFAPGKSLYHLWEGKEFKLDVEWTRFYVAELVVALEDLHNKNIIHRDIKPENILIDSEGHIKLTDFGVSRILKKNEKAKTKAGTDSYMAPEIILGKAYDKTVDWWSVGCVMYTLLEGSLVFKNEFEAKDQITNNLFKLKFNSLKNSDAEDLINQFLRVDPKKRLGAGKDGINKIKRHNFFKGIDWDSVKNRQLKPPFVPKKEDYENAKASGVFDDTVEDFKDENFEGFAFTSESLTEKFKSNLIDVKEKE